MYVCVCAHACACVRSSCLCCGPPSWWLGRMPGYICTGVLGSYYCVRAWVCVLIWPSGHLKGTELRHALLSECVSGLAVLSVFFFVFFQGWGGGSDTCEHVCLCVCLLFGLFLPGEICWSFIWGQGYWDLLPWRVHARVCVCPVNHFIPLKCNSHLFSQVWIHDSHINFSVAVCSRASLSLLLLLLLCHWLYLCLTGQGKCLLNLPCFFLQSCVVKSVWKAFEKKSTGPDWRNFLSKPNNVFIVCKPGNQSRHFLTFLKCPHAFPLLLGPKLSLLSNALLSKSLDYFLLHFYCLISFN